MEKQTESFENAIPKVSNIYGKLWRAKQEIGKITKSSDNPFFKSKYADLNTILEVVEPILHKYDLLLLQPIKDNNVYSIVIDINTGKKIESCIGLPSVSDPQKLGGCVSYFRRYTLQSLLSLSMQDDDANEITQHVKKTFPQDRFQAGLNKVQSGELTAAQFTEALKGYELTELQTKAIMLL